MSSQAKSGKVRPFLFDRVLAEGRGRASGRAGSAGNQQSAYDEAYRKGEKAGFEVGLQRGQEVLQRMHELVQGLEKTREELYVKLEEEMLELVLRIAEKVVHHEIRENDNTRTSILAAGLRKMREEDRITVRVAPGDLAAIQEALPSLCEQIGVLGQVTLQEDPAVTPGGCTLETDRCVLDARIEKALETIEEALRKA